MINRRPRAARLGASGLIVAGFWPTGALTGSSFFAKECVKYPTAVATKKRTSKFNSTCLTLLISMVRRTSWARIATEVANAFPRVCLAVN